MEKSMETEEAKGSIILQTGLHSLLPDWPQCRVWERAFTVQTAQGLLHNAWPPATRWAKLCWISGRKTPLLLLWANEGQQRPLKTGILYCPPPPRRALDHPSNLLHECTQSATHQRANADMGQTGGIRWDYHPRCPLLFWCPSLTNSPLPLPHQSLPSFPPSLPSSPACPALALQQRGQAETRKRPLSSPLSQPQPHANTLLRKLNQTHRGTHRLYKITGLLSLFNEGHDVVNPG